MRLDATECDTPRHGYLGKDAENPEHRRKECGLHLFRTLERAMLRSAAAVSRGRSWTVTSIPSGDQDQMPRQFQIPFVLRRRTLLPPVAKPKPDQSYDAERQIWVLSDSGEPLVVQYERRQIQCSDFGETSLTKTSEGHDQREVLSRSEFGETVATRTAEGTDQSEILASEFGETVMTETSEGHDRTECIALSDFDPAGETAPNRLGYAALG